MPPPAPAALFADAALWKGGPDGFGVILIGTFALLASAGLLLVIFLFLRSRRPDGPVHRPEDKKSDVPS
jgi:hypothetical protein